ncbi:hypothetical protein PG991_010936 [Apiospora marii]|uniref:Uncharacterized protein n=1 Tax=Apiospora marii TaxID=335849 RepID=A0ABR1RD13_9PEZI
MARRSGTSYVSIQIAATVPAGSQTRISAAATAGDMSVQVAATLPASSSATLSATVASKCTNEKVIRDNETAKRTKRRGRRVDTVMSVQCSTAAQTQRESLQASAPGFTRQGSYYETNITDAAEYTYLEASDVRRQVQEAPSRLRSQGGYPKVYRNNPPLPLSSSGPHVEYPIVPSPLPGEAGANYRRGTPPGPVRAIYSEGDRSRFDVGFHDQAKASLLPQTGQNDPKAEL